MKAPASSGGDRRPRRWRRDAARAAVVVVAVVLAGCGGGDGAAPTPSPHAYGAASTSGNRVLFRASYAGRIGAQSVRPPWDGEQEPSPDRMTVAAAPGAPDGALHVELRPYSQGDRTNTGGYLASRAEVYARQAPGGTAPEAWPDPVGSVRWYGTSVLLPEGFPTSDTLWLDLLQLKGLRGGSPRVALEVDGDRLELGGTALRQDIGPITPGRWTTVLLGVRLFPDPSRGSITVVRDGRLVVPTTPAATMDLVDGAPDPVYLKQGIYRARDWPVTQVVDFGTTVVATSAGAAMLGLR